MMIHSCILFVLLLLSCNLALVTAQCQDNGIEVGGSLCECFSGYAGYFSCDPAPAECPRSIVSPTTTTGAPIISSSFVSNHSVNIQIQSSIVIGRTVSRFSVGDCDLSFVKLNNWLDNDCKDTFLASFPLVDTAACNISKTISGNYYVYDLPVVVRNTETVTVGDFDITRNLYDTLSVQIKLPRTVETGNTTTVTSTVEIHAVLTTQAYLNDLNKVSLEFVTISSEPFYLSNASFTSFPSGYSLDNFAETSAPGSGSGARVQTFSALLSPQSACTMNGAYVFDFTVLAQGHPGSVPATITFDLTSSNFCSVIDVPVTLSSRLVAYSDAAHTTVKNDFSISDIAYFDVETHSPETNIVEEVIEKITVSTSSSFVILYENGVTSPHGTLASLQVSASSFSLHFVNTVFVVFPGQQDVYDISVKVAVTYEGLEKKRREEVRKATFKTSSSNAASQVVLGEKQITQPEKSDDESTPSTSSVITSSFFTLLSFSIMVMMAAMC